MNFELFSYYNITEHISYERDTMVECNDITNGYSESDGNGSIKKQHKLMDFPCLFFNFFL